MAYKVKPASIFGRIGDEAGKGLAEAIPKEVERSRLASGLKALGQKKGLDPVESFGELAAIPGAVERPQLLQTYGDLLRQRGIREGFAANRGAEPQTGATARAEIQRQQQNQENILPQQGNIPSGFQNREQEATATPGGFQENPLQEKFIPGVTWTQQERDDDLYREMSRNPNLSFEQAAQRVADNERRALQQPEDYRAQQQYLKDKETEAESEFDKQLSTILQKEIPKEGGKEGAPIYKDLTGEEILNMKKAMYNDLATNGKMSTKQAAEKWAKKGKDFARVKGDMKEKAYKPIQDKILPRHREETLKSLQSAGKIFSEMGSSKDFYNILRTGNNQDTGAFGFDLTPGYAALVAYPRSPAVKNLSDLYSKSSEFLIDPRSASRKVAEEFGKNRAANDSILAFARDFKDSNRFFDDYSFFDYLRENQDRLKLTPDQREEIVQGPTDMIRSWGDLALFPLTGRSKAHD